MLVTGRSRSRGVAPSMTMGSVTTRVSTRVIFMARVCYTAARGRGPAPRARRSAALHIVVSAIAVRLAVAAVAVRAVAVFPQRRDRAIHRRRRAGEPVKHHREVAARAKADGARDRIDREVAVEQEPARAVDATLHHEAVA